MRRAFTLIELLVVIGIMGTMATVGVVSLNGSRGSTRLFAATRDVMAMIRRARSVALVTQKPVVVIYSNAKVEDEAVAKVEIQSEKLFTSKKETGVVRNLAGDVISGEEEEKTKGIDLVKITKSTETKSKEKASRTSEGKDVVTEGEDESAGETLEDVLSPETISTDVVKGLKLKALANDEQPVFMLEAKRSSISIFSTADNVSRTYNAGKEDKEKATEGLDEATEEPMKVVFAANGTVDPPHKIWIYKETSTPEKGLCIEVDRFGEPKCLSIED